MIVQPDWQVKVLLRELLKQLRTDASPLDIVFGQQTSGERSEIRRFFQGNIVKVAEGYPREAADLPGYYVTIGASEEVDKFIGAVMPDDETPEADFPVEGSYFSISLNISCCAANALLTIWMSNIGLWALLGARTALVNAGLIDQSISMRDFAPDSRINPEFTFRRDLQLNAKFPATFETFTDVPIITDIKVNPTVVPNSPDGVVNFPNGPFRGIGDE